MLRVGREHCRDVARWGGLADGQRGRRVCAAYPTARRWARHRLCARACATATARTLAKPRTVSVHRFDPLPGDRPPCPSHSPCAPARPGPQAGDAPEHMGGTTQCPPCRHSACPPERGPGGSRSALKLLHHRAHQRATIHGCRRPQTEDCSPRPPSATASRAHPHPCSTLSDPSPASSSPPRCVRDRPPSPCACRRAAATLSPNSRSARACAAQRRRSPAPGSLSNSRFSAAIRDRAAASQRLRPRTPRNEPAPALARTFVPSIATSSRLTAPDAASAATCAQQIVQKRAVTAAKRAQTVIVHRNTAAKPHISRIPLHNKARRRAEPTPSKVANSHNDNKTAGSDAGRPSP